MRYKTILALLVVVFSIQVSIAQEKLDDFYKVYEVTLQEYDKFIKYAYFLEEKSYYLFIEEVKMDTIDRTFLDPVIYLRFTFSDCYSDLQKHKNSYYHLFDDSTFLVVVDSINTIYFDLVNQFNMEVLTNESMGNYFTWSNEYNTYYPHSDTTNVETICGKNTVFEFNAYRFGRTDYNLLIEPGDGGESMLMGLQSRIRSRLKKK